MNYQHTKLPRKSRKPKLLSKYGIKYKDIAKAFGYSSANSFNGAHAKMDMLRGIEWIIKQVEDKLNKD